MPHRMTPWERVVALVDVAERLVLAAKRKGESCLSPEQQKVVDYWLKERDRLERRALRATELPLCDHCPLHRLAKNRNHKPRRAKQR
jgi:hypothetical protein